MSDMGLPFDGAPPAETGGQRKKVVLLAAVAVLALLLAVLVVPKLLASDSEPVAKPAAAAGAKAKKAPAKKKAKAAAKPAKWKRTIAVDPFKDLYLPPGERPAAKAPKPGSSTAPGGGTTTGKEFTLVDVKGVGATATVSVLYDGKNYDAIGVGKSFADGKFKVVSADGKCASFLYGDQQFALCEGEKAFEYV